jgi:DNA repair exonuclease SbcCD ATPase subunit
VCKDAHPRLRPIAETIERQLAVLEDSIQDQRCALAAKELQEETDGLTRTQSEMRRHLEHLLARRQAHTFGARSAREDSHGTNLGFSAADAEILENRRLELEHERFALVEQVNAAAKKLKSLRAERDAIERQRASLLSARSIEHVQRELAAVQQKLELATGGLSFDETDLAAGDPTRASDFLAQLTNGDLVKLTLVGQGRKACVINREGATIAVDVLTGAQRDQVYISLCLSLLSAASRKGVWLPLVLDEPFERLDARGTAALVAVLDVFCRQGHQVFVFTRKQDATERLASVGAAVHNIASLRRWGTEVSAPVTYIPPRETAIAQVAAKTRHDGEAPGNDQTAPRPSIKKRKKVPGRSRKHRSEEQNDAA